MNIFILPTNTCFWIACPISEIDSYSKIYEIKSRDFSKPLAILIEDFNYLEKNTNLSVEQINFLKNYKNPFTILIEKEKIIDNNLLKNISNINKLKIYSKIAFRVSHNFMQKKLNRLYWPLFLTSANKSNNSEIFDSKKIKKVFKQEIIENNIKIFAHNDFCINSKQKTSDIFEFVEDTIKIKYLRRLKNE